MPAKTRLLFVMLSGVWIALALVAPSRRSPSPSAT